MTSYAWQGVNFQNISRIHPTQQNANNPNKKWQKDLNGYFSKDIHTAYRHMKKMFSTTYYKKCKQNYKITLYPCENEPQKDNDKHWQRWGEKGTQGWGECNLIEYLWETIWGFFKEINMKVLCDPTMALLSINLKNEKTLIWRGLWTPMFLAVFTKIDGTSLMHINRQLDEEIVDYIFDGILFRH